MNNIYNLSIIYKESKRPFCICSSIEDSIVAYKLGYDSIALLRPENKLTISQREILKNKEVEIWIGSSFYCDISEKKWAVSLQKELIAIVSIIKKLPKEFKDLQDYFFWKSEIENMEKNLKFYPELKQTES